MKKRFRLKWIDLGVVRYARRLNRAWRRRNRTYLTVLGLLTPKKHEQILIDDRQKSKIDG